MNASDTVLPRVLTAKRKKQQQYVYIVSSRLSKTYMKHNNLSFVTDWKTRGVEKFGSMTIFGF